MTQFNHKTKLAQGKRLEKLAVPALNMMKRSAGMGTDYACSAKERGMKTVWAAVVCGILVTLGAVFTYVGVDVMAIENVE